MFSLQSGLRPGVWQSAKSRSATPRRSRTSSGLVRCSLSQPLASQSLKLTFAPDQEDARRAQDAHEKVVTRRLPPAKLLRRVHRGIHLASKRLLCRGEGGGDIRERGVPHHEEVHVAPPALVPAGKGAM